MGSVRLFRSIGVDIGSDAADSFAEHCSSLVRLMGLEMVRRFKNYRDVKIFQEEFVGTPHEVVVVPIGEVRSRIIFEVTQVLKEIFGMDVYIARSRTPAPNVWTKGKKSYHIHGDRILSQLASVRNSLRIDGSHVIGITEMELANDQGERMHGYASLNIPVGIISSHYMGFDVFTDDEAWWNLAKVTIHEVGHTFGIPHCDDDLCVMQAVGERGLSALDISFCTPCFCRLNSDRKIKGGDSCSVPAKERN
jgi:archaemetzincin